MCEYTMQRSYAMKRTTVCLSEPEWQEMTQLAKQKDIKFSDLLRRVISEYLEKQKQLQKES